MRIAIIGGGGRMGRWFAGFLKKEGFAVTIAGRDKQKLSEAGNQLGVTAATNKEAAEQADIIVLSVPINGFENAVKEIAPYVRPEQKIVDITSVKTLPVEVMHTYFKDNLILGTHPLFGPGAKSVAGMNFVLTPASEKENTFAQKVRLFLEMKSAHVTMISPEEHDEMMTVILGLSHFIALVSADTLSGIKDMKKLESISGITYKVLLTLVESVVSEDPELYAAIQTSLDGLPELESRFQRNAALWAEIVKNRDSEQFVKRMETLKESFSRDTDFGKSYDNMYWLAEKRSLNTED